MHLDNKSLLFLVSPFVVASGIWFFTADSLVEGLHYFFEPAQQQKVPTLEEKKATYAFITQNKEHYGSLLKKMQTRHDNRLWISERLYHPYSPPIAITQPEVRKDLELKLPPALLRFGEGNITSPVSATPTWSVQMVLPDQNIAVINNQIYHVGQSSRGVKLLEVTSSKIHIQTAKGSQWVKLFH